MKPRTKILQRRPRKIKRNRNQRALLKLDRMHQSLLPMSRRSLRRLKMPIQQPRKRHQHSQLNKNLPLLQSHWQQHLNQLHPLPLPLSHNRPLHSNSLPRQLRLLLNKPLQIRPLSKLLRLWNLQRPRQKTPKMMKRRKHIRYLQRQKRSKQRSKRRKRSLRASKRNRWKS